MTHMETQRGFSLVELSIVLVIIGLIVSGVLVGQDLIRSAEIRATVGQIEKYNTAVNTFRGKYGKIPGDINNADAFGLDDDAYIAAECLLGNGDGNGLLSDENGESTIINGTCEIVNFWVHLSNAALVDGKYYGEGTNAPGDLNVGNTFPMTKLGRGGIIAYQLNGFNHYHIGLEQSASGSDIVGNALAYTSALTPAEAFNIDSKFDDGRPFTGQVTAQGGATAAAAPDYVVGATAGSAPTNCGFGGATVSSADQYDVGVTNINCQLRLRMN